jgi:hypothetical protein
VDSQMTLDSRVTLTDCQNQQEAVVTNAALPSDQTHVDDTEGYAMVLLGASSERRVFCSRRLLSA